MRTPLKPVMQISDSSSTETTTSNVACVKDRGLQRNGNITKRESSRANTMKDRNPKLKLQLKLMLERGVITLVDRRFRAQTEMILRKILGKLWIRGEPFIPEVEAMTIAARARSLVPLPVVEMMIRRILGQLFKTLLPFSKNPMKRKLVVRNVHTTRIWMRRPVLKFRFRTS